MTPMEEQYLKIKSEYSNYIILFRLGDFFEAFNDDAIILSKTLGITLTSRGKGDDKKPMAGVPHHSLSNYLPKLVKAGLKVAIADQVEEATPGKLVERQVTKLITPGTVMDENTLDSSKNNYAISIYYSGKLYYISIGDITTGSLSVMSMKTEKELYNQIKKINPSEIISEENTAKILYNFGYSSLEVLDNASFEEERCVEYAKKHFNVQSFKGYGISDNSKIVVAAALLRYFSETQRSSLRHFKTIKNIENGDTMSLDPETIRNLELVFTMNYFDDDSYTVYNVLNMCKTAMGKRLLRNWLLNPLVSKDKIIERQSAVQFFYEDRILTAEVREMLAQIFDIERLASKLGILNINPKELRTLSNSLRSSLEVIELLHKQNNKDLHNSLLANLIEGYVKNSLKKIDEFIQTVDKAILTEPSATITEGRIINDGYSKDVDELRDLQKNSKKILAKMQASQIEETGITSLKISFNKVFGYYIEVTKAHLDKVPSNYIRKQTLANAERYITQELKELEEKIVSSEEKIIKIENQLYLEILDKLVEFLDDVMSLGQLVSNIDVLANLAFVAKENSFVKPYISDKKNVIQIKNGRHPVVEKLVENYTPNDLEFSESGLVHIITGPNMSGKSTFIRQTALLVLLAQIGSFVPADEMTFSLADRIFTRVGASDNLSRGESTFMVEMIETANILNNATEKSLIILDEVGRGTSTYDGVAIAWAIVEHIVSKLKCRTLFATHYHELTALERRYKNINNLNVEVWEDRGEITFKHKIAQGATNKSYGVHVAKIAGVPDDVVKRANQILDSFENKQVKTNLHKAKKVQRPKRIHPEQLKLGDL